MAEPKWSPGPWELFPSEMPGIDAAQGDHAIIMFGEGDDECGIRGRTPEEAQANARLIVSAPLMAETLERVERLIAFDLKRMIVWGDDYNQAVRDVFDAVVATLALARGDA